MFNLAIAVLMAASTTAADTTAAEAERAPTVEATDTATASKDADAKPKKICRKVQSTGSRLTSGKLCKTAEEWKRFLAE